MLQQFCAKNGWEVTAVFQDDGFTGLNMDRPGLKKMLHAIEKGAINLVVTKDDCVIIELNAKGPIKCGFCAVSSIF